MLERSLTKNQAKRIDSQAGKGIGISALIMMENAGVRCADFILKILRQKKNKGVAVFCGKGNNCGDGLVVSRQLICAGINVQTYLLSSATLLSKEAKRNFKILSRMSKDIYRIKDKRDLDRINFGAYGVLVDAIFGIGLKGNVTGIFKDTIEKINSAQKNIVLSIDIPSGLDADRGLPLGVAVKADYTVSLVAAKKGLLVNRGKEFTGKLVVRHIGFLA